MQFTVLEAFVIGERYTVLIVNALTQDWRVKIGSTMVFELNGKQRRISIQVLTPLAIQTAQLTKSGL